MSSREFVDTITRDLLGSRVFVFTPGGEVNSARYFYSICCLFGSCYIITVQLCPLQIKHLPKGATVIDYAYMIHTEIGNKMVAAKVLFLLLSVFNA